MVYGHYITDTVGNERFFAEGCSYCHMSTGGQHEFNCPCKDIKINDKLREWTKLNFVIFKDGKEFQW